MHAAYDFYLCIKYFIHMTIFIFYACLDRLCLKFKWTSAFANKDQKKGPSEGMKLFGSERFTQNPVNFNVSLTQEGQVQLRHQQVPCRDRRGGWERRRGFGAVCQDVYEGESVCVCVCVCWFLSTLPWFLVCCLKTYVGVLQEIITSIKGSISTSVFSAHAGAYIACQICHIMPGQQFYQLYIQFPKLKM